MSLLFETWRIAATVVFVGFEYGFVLENPGNLASKVTGIWQLENELLSLR